MDLLFLMKLAAVIGVWLGVCFIALVLFILIRQEFRK